MPVGSNLLLLLAGFGDRLLSEVKKLAPKDIKIRVRLSCTSLAHICMYQTEILMYSSCIYKIYLTFETTLIDFCSAGKTVFYLDRVNIESLSSVIIFDCEVLCIVKKLSPRPLKSS